MSNRQQRLQSIISILKTHVISSQDELQRMLISSGIIITQATLSRDLKYLNVAKVALNDGTYKYEASKSPSIDEKTGVRKDREIPRGNITEIGFSGQLAVVKTRPGYANAIAYDIDTHGSELILGTIAGDDTIMVIPREGYTRETIEEYLMTLK